LADLARALSTPPALPTTNPFASPLLDYLSGPSPGIFGSLAPPTRAPLPLQPDYVSGLLGLAAPSSGIFGSLAPSPPALPVQPYVVPAPAPVKRKGFFSFHFDDLFRVNNVRKA
jgi:hypothetical protein